MRIYPEVKATRYEIASQREAYLKWAFYDDKELKHKYLINALKKIIRDELTEKQKLYLKDNLSGMKTREIARKYGVNQSSVSRSISSAKRRIDRYLKYIVEWNEIFENY